MTIAVAVRKGGETVIAADTQNNFGHNRVPMGNHRTQRSWLSATLTWPPPAGVCMPTSWMISCIAGGRRGWAASGTCSVFQNFWKALHEHYSLVNDQCQGEEESSPFGDLDASFLLVNGDGIFFVSSDTAVTAFEQYYAVGSGAEFALGALHALYDSDLDAEALARRACAAAMAFNLFCGGEIDVCRVPATP